MGSETSSRSSEILKVLVWCWIAKLARAADLDLFPFPRRRQPTALLLRKTVQNLTGAQFASTMHQTVAVAAEAAVDGVVLMTETAEVVDTEAAEAVVAMGVIEVEATEEAEVEEEEADLGVTGAVVAVTTEIEMVVAEIPMEEVAEVETVTLIPVEEAAGVIHTQVVVVVVAVVVAVVATTRIEASGARLHLGGPCNVSLGRSTPSLAHVPSVPLITK